VLFVRDNHIMQYDSSLNLYLQNILEYSKYTFNIVYGLFLVLSKYFYFLHALK